MIYFIAVKMEGQRRKGCLSEGSWDVDPGREALGPFGFSVLGGPQGAVLRVRAELGDSLAPAAILLGNLTQSLHRLPGWFLSHKGAFL